MGSPRPRAGDKKTTYDTHNTTTVVNITSYENITQVENVTITETIVQLENITTQENVSVLINETVRYNATYVSESEIRVFASPAASAPAAPSTFGQNGAPLVYHCRSGKRLYRGTTAG